MGHLQSFQIGDARYYELHEPLMRLSFEVKKHRGKPIGLLLDFLRLWYSPAELKQKMALLPPKSSLDYSFMPAPKILEQNWEDPRIAECCREYGVAIQKKDYEHALRAAEDLASIRGLKEDSIAQASCLIHLGQYEQAVAVYDRMIEAERTGCHRLATARMASQSHRPLRQGAPFLRYIHRDRSDRVPHLVL